MPNLLLFAPCEKAIVDETNNLSLIAILEAVTLEVSADQPLPPKFAVPLNWAVVALWANLPDEIGETFQQRTLLVHDQSKEIIVDNTVEFTFEAGKPHHRVVARAGKFPISSLGAYSVTASIRRKVEPPEEWREVAQFPIVVASKPFDQKN